MGEPAEPTDSERIETLEYAHKLVDAVTNDEAWPFPFAAVSEWQGSSIAPRVFSLAQMVVKLEAALLEALAMVPDGYGPEQDRAVDELRLLVRPSS